MDIETTAKGDISPDEKSIWSIDFEKITACGGDCTGCVHFTGGECCGCNKNGGRCVKMWEKGCDICACCREHDVSFCGLCGEFPCQWLKNKAAEWDKDGSSIARMESLAEEYRRRREEFSVHLPTLWKKIVTHGVMALSTCADDRVTSRPVSVAVINGKFFCQTDEGYLKCRQIRKNPNAALCFDKFSIEGICRIIGKPREHDFFMDRMKKYYPNAVRMWSDTPGECVIEITPKLIRLWDYELSKAYMEYWDFVNLSYRKEWK